MEDDFRLQPTGIHIAFLSADALCHSQKSELAEMLREATSDEPPKFQSTNRRFHLNLVFAKGGEITRRNRGISISQRLQTLNWYLRG